MRIVIRNDGVSGCGKRAVDRLGPRRKSSLGLTGDDLLAVFEPYRPASLTAKTGIANLRRKLADDDFRHDLDAFTTTMPDEYDLDGDAEMIINEILSKLPTHHER